ncbi:hypothetical protein ACFFQF_06645 [Haladaptatus pallidirubidus]|uniref:MYXO-CTERM domain-containing protein n=1 Tax=Haladaptatus pallidirubidus TaxID=1008152 RepID=A0AAV3UM62_9EURY|nr:hypothetical protein [Haladaptatus pallidirubidus]
MSLLEVNIEKPALVEERVYPNEDTAPASARTKTESSERSVVSLIKPLVGLLVVAAVALFARKLRAPSDETEDDSASLETDDFETDEFNAESGRGKSAAGVVGVLVSLLGVIALARKVRGGSVDE